MAFKLPIKIKLKQRLAVAVISLLSFGVVEAQPNCCYEFGAGIEALYLQPTNCALLYAEATSGNFEEGPSQEKLWTMPGDTDWGVRASAFYRCACHYAKFDYTWWRTDQCQVARRGSLEGMNVYVVLPTVEISEVNGRLQEQYQRADLRVGADFCCSRCGTLGLYGNVRWAEVHFRIRSEAISQAGLSHLNYGGRFEGAGLGAGVEVSLPLWCQFQGHLQLGLTGLIGRRSSADTIAQDPVSNFNPVLIGKGDTVVIPAMDCRVGLKYAWSCSCLGLEGKLGYQLDYLPRAFSVFNTITKSVDFGLSGLYFGLSASY